MKLFNIATGATIAILIAVTAAPVLAMTATPAGAPTSNKVCKTDPTTKKETCIKKICKVDPKTKKETCKIIKIHKKLEGTKVPTKK